MIHPLVKKHFLKNGLPMGVLQSINGMIEKSITNDSTDDEVIEICKAYDAFAKSFQSEVDAKVAKAKKVASSKNAEDEEDEDEEEQPVQVKKPKSKTSKTDELLLKLIEKVERLENEKVSSSLIDKATAKMKELKMTDSEIKALLHGRTFEDEEQVNSFIETQSELYEEVLKERVSLNLGNGNKPASAKGEISLESFKQDLEQFNKTN